MEEEVAPTGQQSTESETGAGGEMLPTSGLAGLQPSKETTGERDERKSDRGKDADKEDRALRNSRWALFGSILSTLIAVGGVWFTHVQPARIDAFLGDSVLIDGSPKLGLQCTFTNSGARDKVINHILLRVSGPDDAAAATFRVSSVSSTLPSWAYDTRTSKMLQESRTEHWFFSGVRVPARGEIHLAIWFLPEFKGFTFKRGQYTIVLCGYGESKTDIVLEKSFDFDMTQEHFDGLQRNPDQLRQVNLSPWR